MEEGKEYKVTFDAKSPDYSTLVISAMSHMPDDYHDLGLSEEVNTSPDWEKFEFYLTPTDTVAVNRIGFILGRDVGTVHLRNFKMVEVK